MFDLKYAYLFGGIILCVIWAIIFSLRKDLRREMLAMSFFMLGFAFTGGLYNDIYWSPLRVFIIEPFGIGIEDFIYMFTIGGIGSVSYEFFFRKVHNKIRSKVPIEIRKIEILVSGIAGFVLILYLQAYSNLNVLMVHSAGLILISFLFIYFERRIMLPVLFNFILFGFVIMFVEMLTGVLFPGFRGFWNDSVLLGINIGGFPIEELIFHSAWGAAVSCIYEFYIGLRDK